MSYSWIIWLAIYVLVGWVLSDAVEEGSDVDKIVVFITWPLIIVMLLFMVALIIVIALLHFILTIIFKFLGWID